MCFPCLNGERRVFNLKFVVLFFLMPYFRQKKELAKQQSQLRIQNPSRPFTSEVVSGLSFSSTHQNALFQSSPRFGFFLCELEFEAWQTQQGVQRCCWQSARSLRKKWMQTATRKEAKETEMVQGSYHRSPSLLAVLRAPRVSLLKLWDSPVKTML